jgi:hypothetical protein
MAVCNIVALHRRMPLPHLSATFCRLSRGACQRFVAVLAVKRPSYALAAAVLLCRRLAQAHVRCLLATTRSRRWLAVS